MCGDPGPLWWLHTGRPASVLSSPSNEAPLGIRQGRGQDRPRCLVAGRPGRQGPARTRPDQPCDRTMARGRSMNGKLTDEAYARAALTYLAEPTDRWLGQLIRVHGAAVTLNAIKTGRPLGATELVGKVAGQRTGSGVPRGKAHEAIKAAMERWRTRLPELPTPEQILAFGESGIRLAGPGDP